MQLNREDQTISPETTTENGKSKEDEDRWIVKWDGKDDPGDPLNTSIWKKWYVIAVIVEAL